jgi:hypothetical protein
MRGLPSNWSTYYDGSRMYVDVEGPVLEASKGMCHHSLNPIHGDKNEMKIVFEDSINAAKTKASDTMH